VLSGSVVAMTSPRPRWFTDTEDGHSEWYVDRFRNLARDGADLEGEARLVDAMVSPKSRILDAGCGPGRTGGALHRRGHQVVGVDVDPVLIEAARADHPGPRWLIADLSTLDLSTAGEGEPFDAIVCAGNVMVFLAPGSEAAVLRTFATHLADDGFVIVGFRMGDRLSLSAFDDAVKAARLRVEHRFATWDLRPWHRKADFAVTVLRHQLR
jgi:SAM-dependent methyltransferase